VLRRVSPVVRDGAVRESRVRRRPDDRTLLPILSLIRFCFPPPTPKFARSYAVEHPNDEPMRMLALVLRFDSWQPAALMQCGGWGHVLYDGATTQPGCKAGVIAPETKTRALLTITLQVTLPSFSFTLRLLAGHATQARLTNEMSRKTITSR
jgi:hypothetical protein